MANRSRDRGNGYERDIVNELKELGYDVVTSRSESKRMDDKKVDIFSPLGTPVDQVFPYYVQNKFTAVNPAYHKILMVMPQDRPGIIFHKKSEARENKNGKVQHFATGEFVTMKKQVFYDLLEKNKMNLQEGKKLFDWVLQLPENERETEIKELKDVLMNAVDEMTAEESLDLLQYVLDKSFDGNQTLTNLLMSVYKTKIKDGI